jgi:hypothetical protein
MPKSLSEWEKYYEAKTGRPILSKAFAQCLIDLSKGFMYFAFNADNDLVVCATCGDGKYWEKKALEIAKLHGSRWVFTTIYKRPKAYQRRFPGYKFKQLYDQNKKINYWIMYREVC